MICKAKLLCCKLLNIHRRDQSVSEEVKIIYTYGFLSWLLTSFVYMTGRPYSIIIFKLGVVGSLFILTTIITDLYMKHKENKGILKTLLLIETFGIVLLLLPTGGVQSPFIWYALNPILVAASYLPAYFCWMNLTFNFIVGTAMSYFLFNPSNLNAITIFMNNSTIALVFILITLAVQLLSNLTKKLSMQTNALKISNMQKQESMDYIMSLYQIIEALNNHSTKGTLFEALADYTAKLTKSELCFFWLPGSPKDGELIKANRCMKLLEQQQIGMVLHMLSQQDFALRVEELVIADINLLTIPILSPGNPSGLIAIQQSEYVNLEQREQNIKLLEFVSGLSTVMLERFTIEEIENNLIVMEEQNRIANEIHDSVSQRLFSLSYAIYGMLGSWKNISKEEIKEYMVEMSKSSTLAMQELRNSIYKLSSKKKGENTLKVSLNDFLESMSKLHQIDIEYKIQGDEGLLPLLLKQGITRIVREACSNAIRHGKCHSVHFVVKISKERVRICITDDGIGFVRNDEDLENQKGLGISNIKNIVDSFNGQIDITSEIGIGTVIKINIALKIGFLNEQMEGIVV